MMNTLQIANKLVALCREGRNEECQQTLYSPDIVSVEAAAPPGGQREARGLDAIKAKSKWWRDNHEVHSAEVSDPYPHGDDRFGVRFTYDVTLKSAGKRFKMDELAIFYVKDGKIVREEFFYPMS